MSDYRVELDWAQTLPSVCGDYYILFPHEKRASIQRVDVDGIGWYFTDHRGEDIYLAEEQRAWFLGPLPEPTLPPVFKPGSKQN